MLLTGFLSKQAGQAGLVLKCGSDPLEAGQLAGLQNDLITWDKVILIRVSDHSQHTRLVVMVLLNWPQWPVVQYRSLPSFN